MKKRSPNRLLFFLDKKERLEVDEFMNDFMIAITTPSHHVLWRRLDLILDTAFIQLIDFSTLDDTKELEKPDIIKKLVKHLFPLAEEKYIDVRAYQIQEFLKKYSNIDKKENIFNKVLLNTYIMRDSKGKIRIIQNTNLRIHKLLLNKVIKILVYDKKEEVAKYIDPNETNKIIDPLIYYKKICGNILFVKEMEKSHLSGLDDIVSQSISLNVPQNNSIDDLGFLIEYHDVKPSTIEYVEEFFDRKKVLNHASVMISGENRVFEVVKTEDMICLVDLNKIKIDSFVLN